MSAVLAEAREYRAQLALVGRVLRLHEMLQWSLRLLTVGLVADLLWLGGTSLFPYAISWPALVAAPVTLALVGAFAGALWPMKPQELAQRADSGMGLKERMVTALELLGRGASRPLELAQVRDAVLSFSRREPLEAFPLRLPRREALLGLGLAAAVVLLYFVPNPLAENAQRREQTFRIVRLEAEKLRAQADELAARPGSEFPAEPQALLRETALRLEQARSVEEAMAALEALEQRLMSLEGFLDGKVEAALAALATAMGRDSATQGLAQSLASSDLRRASDDLRRLSDSVQGMAESQHQALARALRSGAEDAALSSLGVSRQAAAAAEALGRDPQAAASDLRRLANQLSSQAGRQQALSQAQQSRQRLGQAAGRASARQQGQAPGASRQPGSLQEGNQAGEGPRQGMDRPGGSSYGEGTQPSEMVYDPVFMATRLEFVPGQEGFRPSELADDPFLKAGEPGQAQVDYSQVFPEYQRRATRSLETSQVPPAMQDLVRQYFSRLDPTARPGAAE